MMNNIKRFTRAMGVMGKRLPIYLLSILAMSVSNAMFAVMGSLLMKNIVDIAQTKSYQSLAHTVLIIVIVGILVRIVFGIASIVYNVEAKRVLGFLSEEVLDTEMKLPYSYYEKHHSGEIISKVSYDLTGMGNIFGSRFRRVIMPFLEVVVFLVPMFALSWQLTLCLVAVNTVMLIIDLLTAEPMHNINLGLSRINSKMISRLSDMLQGIEQVRMYAAGKDTLEDFRKENKNYARRFKGQIMLSACLESSNRGFELLCSLFFLMLGIYFVNKGYTTLGALAAIYTMYGRFSSQFLMMGRYIPELVACLANAQNIFDFLDEEREPQNWYTDNKDVTAVQKGDIAVDIEGLEFSYNEAAEVLNDFSMHVKTGECVAIVGASGCGKTTLSKLMLGLYPVSGGDMWINGFDMRAHSLDRLREQIAYVPQEPYLFQGTIRENIMLGNTDAAEADMIEAARLANAHDFIMEFADGYDTIVGERGNNLSGGQRQRIAIARAVMKNAPIILMDEATSALDNESERLVNDALKKLQGGRTIVMIAHRPSTIALADRVIELKEKIC